MAIVALTFSCSYRKPAGASYMNTIPIGSGSISLIKPSEGALISYDEMNASANFNWSGGNAWVVLSRNQSMDPIKLRKKADGSISIQLWPGTWYWQVENKDGPSDVRSFTIVEPIRRDLQITRPVPGKTIDGNGGLVSWVGDSGIAQYRVELSQGSWANPRYRFATSKNLVQLRGVTPGDYLIRVGAFSEVAGRWEYTQPIAVTIQ